MADLPYFDHFFAELETPGNPLMEALATRGDLHWGYWEEPDDRVPSLESFLAATDALTRQLLGLAAPRSGTDILDVGCGIGGTLALIDQELRDVRLTGINIDARQVALARRRVRARPGNQIDFVVGDACALPFPDASFDTVLAVECIFHFPSRERFFREAARVLRPGGRLALCDFVVEPHPAWFFLGWPAALYASDVRAVYGDIRLASRAEYRRCARLAGLAEAGVVDITANTLPTYRFIEVSAAHWGFGHDRFVRANRVVGWGSRLGAMSYLLLAFDRTDDL